MAYNGHRHLKTPHFDAAAAAGAAVRPLLRCRAGLLPHAGVGNDRATPQPLRLLQVGLHTPPAGSGPAQSTQSRRVCHRTLRQVAPRLVSGPHCDKPRGRGVRRVVFGPELLRQRLDSESPGQGRSDQRRKLDGRRRRRHRVHAKAHEVRQAVPGGRLVRLAARPASGDRGRPEAVREVRQATAEFLRRDHRHGPRVRQAAGRAADAGHCREHDLLVLQRQWRPAAPGGHRRTRAQGADLRRRPARSGNSGMARADPQTPHDERALQHHGLLSHAAGTRRHQTAR